MSVRDFQNDDEDSTQTLLRPPVEIPAVSTAYLIVLASQDSTGKMFRLDPGERLIGRAQEAFVRLDGAGISRHHAKLVIGDDGLVQLEDLGSKNGTYVQGERVQGPLKLKDGDKLQIGNATILKLSYQDPLDLAFQETLYTSATRDGMTGAFNKRFFDEAIQKEFSFCARHDVPLSLVMLDVDCFKGINDTWGHLAGDLVLTRLAELVGGSVRNEDVFARIGGEEFAFILRDCPHGNALVLAERMRVSVERMVLDYQGQRIPVTVSAGVATLEGHNHADPELLLSAADAALYRAKREGRNRIVSAAPEQPF